MDDSSATRDERSALKKKLGVYHRRDLDDLGVGRPVREAAIARGTLIAHGNGWYTRPSTPAEVSGPLSRGHRATCVTAAEVYGLWVPRTTEVHEVARRNRGTAPPHVVLAHRPVLRAWPDQEPILPLLVAVHHAMLCLDPEATTVMLESGVERRLLRPHQVRDLLAAVSIKRRRDIGRISTLAGSGTETRVRRYLERRGVRVREQVQIEGVGRVDLLVGERLIIECDSVAHHDSPAAYYVDRRRDADAVERGFVVLRLTWEMVWLDWEATQRQLLTLIHGEVHRVRRSLRQGDGRRVIGPRERIPRTGLS